MHNTNLIQKIESILFYLAEPVSFQTLAKILEMSNEDTLSAVNELGESLKDRGLRLVINENEVVLVTAPEHSETIEKIIKEEREKDLGRAGIETLAIIAYKGPISKKEIEYIRGVNSQYALRSLLLRGLIERKNSETEDRRMGYNITADAVRFLGLSKISELPEYEETRKELEAVEEKEEEGVSDTVDKE